MHNLKSDVQGARPEGQHGDQLGGRIDCQPEPEFLRLVTQGRAKFVELKVEDRQVVQGAAVQAIGLQPGTREPRAERAFAMAENPGGGAEVEAFGHGAKYFSDPVGSGLQSIQGCVAIIAPLEHLQYHCEVE